VRPDDAAEDVEAVAHVGDPVADASFVASLSVAVPLVTSRTSAPRSFMRNTLRL
jgi:hypothetical protein